jgi:hypothetical protein
VLAADTEQGVGLSRRRDHVKSGSKARIAFGRVL